MTKEDGDMSLMELAETSMSQALMLYILANIQILSATGRVGTKYKHLCIDSDKVPRGCAKDFAGYTEHDFESDGITAAHMIAVFLLEITREAEELKKLSEDNEMEMRASMFFDVDEEPGVFELSRKEIQAASGMHALLDFFKNMIGSDISGDIRKLRKEDYCLDPPDRKPVEESDCFPRSHFSPEVVDNDEEGLLNGFFARTHPVLRRRVAKRNQQLQEIAELQENMFSGATSTRTTASATASTTEGQYNKEELKTLLEQAIEKRDFDCLGFIKDFFKQGSTSRQLVESKVEMVWINALYPNECTYGISVDKEKKQVFLSFRGCFTRTDWKRSWQWTFTSTSNPIKESYPGRTQNVKLHGGYHKYLFRVRKDTGTTKYDEITQKLAHYCDLVGEGCRVVVCGHSLGGALGTIFSFYTSTEDRFIRNGAMQTVSFGGPYVGGYKFADAVRHQEAVGKLRIARFAVVKDGVPHLPPALFYLSRRGATYFNNGIDIRLPMRRLGIFKIFPQPQPKLSYVDEISFLKSWFQQVKGWYFINCPLRIWLGPKMHSLGEHKKRMQLVDLLEDRETSPLVRYSLEELYEMRHELKNLK